MLWDVIRDGAIGATIIIVINFVFRRIYRELITPTCRCVEQVERALSKINDSSEKITALLDDYAFTKQIVEKKRATTNEKRVIIDELAILIFNGEKIKIPLLAKQYKISVGYAYQLHSKAKKKAHELLRKSNESNTIRPQSLSQSRSRSTDRTEPNNKNTTHS